MIIHFSTEKGYANHQLRVGFLICDGIRLAIKKVKALKAIKCVSVV
jgi:aspartate/methionine/tyrosine aminotransferase